MSHSAAACTWTANFAIVRDLNPALASQQNTVRPCCQVISKEANFVRVRVNGSTEGAETMHEPTDLLCSVRALLKKIKQTVLVGDSVQVDSIDWADKRGTSTAAITMAVLAVVFVQLHSTPTVNANTAMATTTCTFAAQPTLRNFQSG